VKVRRDHDPLDPTVAPSVFLKALRALILAHVGVSRTTFAAVYLPLLFPLLNFPA
jgi:hypothetical protein